MFADVFPAADVVSRVANGQGLLGKRLPTPHEACQFANVHETVADVFLANIQYLANRMLCNVLSEEVQSSENCLRVLLLTKAFQLCFHLGMAQFIGK